MALQRAAPFAQVDPHRTRNPARAKAKVPEEPFVFRRHNRVFQMRRDGFAGYSAAELITAPGKDRAFFIKQRDRSARAPIQQRRDIGQCGPDITDAQAHDQRRNHRAAPGQTPDQTQDKPYETHQKIALFRLGGFAPRGLASSFSWLFARLASASVCHQRAFSFA